ncbi:hypothetical protein KPO98_004080 [Salmonella enterica]|nr:hypothetical protein [Salmonella enterica]
MPETRRLVVLTAFVKAQKIAALDDTIDVRDILILDINGIEPDAGWSLYIDLCTCLILICSIQHQKQVDLWTKNNCRPWLSLYAKGMPEVHHVGTTMNQSMTVLCN